MHIDKQKLLEWINNELLAWQSPDEEDIRWTYEHIREKIQYGVFDTDDSEIQCLRAVLEKAKQYAMNGYELGYIDDREGYTEALVREIDKALFATTEPTGAERVRELWNITKQRVDEPEDYLQQEYFAGKAIGIMDTLNALGITIPGINAPEGDGNNA